MGGDGKPSQRERRPPGWQQDPDWEVGDEEEELYSPSPPKRARKSSKAPGSGVTGRKRSAAVAALGETNDERRRKRQAVEEACGLLQQLLGQAGAACELGKAAAAACTDSGGEAAQASGKAAQGGSQLVPGDSAVAQRWARAAKEYAVVGPTTLFNYNVDLRKLLLGNDVLRLRIADCSSPKEVAAAMGKCFEWVGQGMPGAEYTGKAEAASIGLLRKLRNSLALNYRALCQVKGFEDVGELRHNDTWRLDFRSTLSLVRPKRGRPAGDPQRHSAVDVLGDEDAWVLAEFFLELGTLEGDRSRAINFIDALGCGRFSDATELFLVDLHVGKLNTRLGPLHRAFFPASCLTANVEYSEEYKAVGAAMKARGIITSKKTHWGRAFMANRLQAAGVPIDDTAFFGRWKCGGGDASTTLRHAYLKFQSPKVLAAAAGYPMSADVGPQEAFFHDRFCVGDDHPGFDSLRRRVLEPLIRPLLVGIGKVYQALRPKTARQMQVSANAAAAEGSQALPPAGAAAGAQPFAQPAAAGAQPFAQAAAAGAQPFAQAAAAATGAQPFAHPAAAAAGAQPFAHPAAAGAQPFAQAAPAAAGAQPFLAQAAAAAAAAAAVAAAAPTAEPHVAALAASVTQLSNMVLQQQQLLQVLGAVNGSAQGAGAAPLAGSLAAAATGVGGAVTSAAQAAYEAAQSGASASQGSNATSASNCNLPASMKLFGSVRELVRLYYHGDSASGIPSWHTLEQSGSQWRTGAGRHKKFSNARVALRLVELLQQARGPKCTIEAAATEWDAALSRQDGKRRLGVASMHRYESWPRLLQLVGLPLDLLPNKRSAEGEDEEERELPAQQEHQPAQQQQQPAQQQPAHDLVQQQGQPRQPPTQQRQLPRRRRRGRQ
ncbi:hypothetical protein ABPG75_003858 [Micractinium tetrahymenae]